MKTIYIDSDFKCHIADDGTMRAVETAFFDDKCDELITGYRCIPKDEYWTREDGKVFTNQITPWRDLDELDKAQREHDRALILDMQNALNNLGVTLDE